MVALLFQKHIHSDDVAGNFLSQKEAVVLKELVSANWMDAVL